MVTFVGAGYDKRQLGDTMKMSDNRHLEEVPSKQSVPVPGQVKVIGFQKEITAGEQLRNPEKKTIPEY